MHAFLFELINAEEKWVESSDDGTELIEVNVSSTTHGPTLLLRVKAE